jgi:sulfite reductase (NADPH) flavoprotein alpha-component
MSQDTKLLPETAPFEGPQRHAAEQLLGAGLSAEQRSWLSGFLAGMGSSAAGSATRQAGAGNRKVTILFGSESGNAEACAQEAAQVLGKSGLKSTIADMVDVNRTKLSSMETLLVIVSTWGEGDPPENATDFHQFFMSDKAPRMDKTRFAVFALGDTSYADFCECGKQFDQRLEALGATRILDRADADVDYEGPFKKWLEAVSTKLAADSQAAPAVSVLEPSGATAAVPAEPYGKKNPFPAPVTTLINLNGRGSAKETYHVELSLEGSGMSYVPGDVLGVFPENCPEVVDDFLKAIDLSGETAVTVGEDSLSLKEALTRSFDITSVNASLMKKYAPLAKNEALDAFLKPDQKEALKEWLWGRELRDLFLEFPPRAKLDPQVLAGMLRKMPPRLYSIASSLNAHPDEVHLTVGAVLYNAHGRDRKGVCSTFLGHRLAVGETALVYTHHNKNFFLPENPDTPIIMVGPGTGIAPFRAFLEERDYLGAKGRNWLFFGDQHFNSDFLYQTEWQKYLKSGLLTRMDVAFSRDTDHKVYVQHRMKEKARDLYAWMEEGAFFYVCGDANRMAKDVHQALIDIYVEEGGLAQEAAETKVKELQKSKRYQRDVY